MQPGRSERQGTKASMPRRWLGRSLLGVCALLLSAPLLLFAFGVRERNFEARRPAPLPTEFIGGWQDPARPGEQLDAYLRDHLPFRYRLTLLYNAMRFYGLGESPVDDVVLGRQGWLFLRDALVERAEHPEGEPLRSARIFDRAIAAAKARRLRLGIFLSPNKASIYPEKLPERWRERRAARVVPWQRELERISDERPSVANLWTRLRAERDAGALPAQPTGDRRVDARLATIYRPRDRHWHWETGRIQAEEMLATLGLRFDPSVQPSLGAYRQANSELAARFLLIDLPEPYAELVGRPHVRAEQLAVAGSPLSIEVYSNPGATNPETLLVFHDSFLEKSLPFLQSSVRKLVLVPWHLWRTHPQAVAPWLGQAEVIAVQSVEDHRGLHMGGLQRLSQALGRLPQ